MKRYTVSGVRERLAEALDEASRGIPVVIERKGTRYRLVVDETPQRRGTRRAHIEILDPAVADGDWRWDDGPGGLLFRGGRG